MGLRCRFKGHDIRSLSKEGLTVKVTMLMCRRCNLWWSTTENKQYTPEDIKRIVESDPRYRSL